MNIWERSQGRKDPGRGNLKTKKAAERARYTGDVKKQKQKEQQQQQQQ